MTLFRQLYDPASRGFAYLLADTDSREAVAVDCGAPGIVLPLLGAVREQELSLRYLLCTHVDERMAGGLRQVREHTGAQIVAGDAAPVDADQRARNGDTLAFGNELIRVLATPGHAPGDLSFLWRDRVFTGETLLIRDCGRIDRADGDAGALFDSITRRLLVLPGETLLFPGRETDHRSVSTIAEERDHNPSIAGLSRDEFVTRRSPA